MSLNAKNRRAVKACALSAAMWAMTAGVQAANVNLGTVSSTPTSFTATPALPAVTNDNYRLRTVDIDDTYNFAVTTQSALSATLVSTSLGGMGGVVTWNLNYSLLDGQSNVLATGVLNPTRASARAASARSSRASRSTALTPTRRTPST